MNYKEVEEYKKLQDEEIVYIHKKTRYEYSLGILKVMIQRGNIRLIIDDINPLKPIISKTGVMGFEVIKRYSYPIKDIPFSDDFEIKTVRK